MAALGNLYDLIAEQARQTQPSMSFLEERFSDIEPWRASTREYLRSLLLYSPERCELNAELAGTEDFPDYLLQKWYISPSPTVRMPVMVLQPHGITGPTPAVTALHCHGGLYYYGKKKLIAEENEPSGLTQYRQQYYDGNAIAGELARRGYIVAVTDSFYFGERRLVVPNPPGMQQEFLLAAEGSDKWIELLSHVSAQYEDVTAKSLFWAGATWPGVLAWDDMRTVDFLMTLPEVDATRIGCVGMSMGGMRAALLGALDTRVKAVCVVGWMSTLAEMLEEKVSLHSWSNFIPGLARALDWPDVVSLHAPNPLLVLQGGRDSLFSLDGFQKAAERLRAIYAKAGAPGSFDIGLYDVGHQFTSEMQEHAWSFLDNALTEQTAESAP